MNTKKKEKALKDYKGFADLQANELTEMLVNDGYDLEKEVPELIEAIKSAQKVQFDLNELNSTEEDDETGDVEFVKCEAWESYKAAERAYNGMKQHVFIKVNASGCFQVKLNSKGDKVTKLVGLKLHKEKPLQETSIQVNTARRLNEQVYNNANAEGSRHYYLIKELIKL